MGCSAAACGQHRLRQLCTDMSALLVLQAVCVHEQESFLRAWKKSSELSFLLRVSGGPSCTYARTSRAAHAMQLPQHADYDHMTSTRNCSIESLSGACCISGSAHSLQRVRGMFTAAAGAAAAACIKSQMDIRLDIIISTAGMRMLVNQSLVQQKFSVTV